MISCCAWLLMLLSHRFPENFTQDAQNAVDREKTGGTSSQTTPDAESVIQAIVRKGRSLEALEPARPKSVGGAHSDKQLLVEGTTIVGRVGRLISSGERWSFVFEGEDKEGPIELLPNLMLERMVYQVKTSSTEPVFVLWGEVTEFEGRNYMLVRNAMQRPVERNLSK